MKWGRENLEVLALPVRAMLLFLFLTFPFPWPSRATATTTTTMMTTTTTTTPIPPTEPWIYGNQPSSGLCGSGKRQSPIEIRPDDVVPDQKTTIALKNYYSFVPKSATVSIDHNSVAIFAGVSPPVQLILDAENVTTIYTLHSLVFHWGDSEHHFREFGDHASASFSLEAHLVHYNRVFASVEEAMRHENGLCVLAILFVLKEEGENNKALDQFISIASGKGGSVRWNDLLPPVTNYSVYQYSGSLTRLPCLETVVWNVLGPPHFSTLNLLQLGWFLVESHDHEVASNSRGPQPLNGRKVHEIRLVSAEKILKNENISVAISPNPDSISAPDEPTLGAYIFSFIPIIVTLALLFMFWYFYRVADS